MNPAEMFAAYAAACRAVGRGGITGERIRELAGREDGIDLEALGADAAALTSAAADADGALSAERTAVGALESGWRGRSASAATDLLIRHCGSAAGVVAGLADAGRALSQLRGRLQRLLEARTEAGAAVAQRRAADHPRWLAGAAAVLNGTADEATVAMVAGELATFVDNDVAGDWASAMTSVTDGVAAAYREAVLVLADRPAVRFEVPSGVVRHSGEQPPARGAQVAAPVAPQPAGLTGAPLTPGGLAGAAPDPGAGLFGPGPGPVAGLFDPGPEPAAGAFDPGPGPAAGAFDPGPEPAAEPEAESEADPEADPEAEPEPELEAAPDGAELPAPDPAAPEPPPPAEPLPAEAGFGADAPAEPAATTPSSPCETAAEALPRIGE